MTKQVFIYLLKMYLTTEVFTRSEMLVQFFSSLNIFAEAALSQEEELLFSKLFFMRSDLARKGVALGHEYKTVSGAVRYLANSEIRWVKCFHGVAMYLLLLAGRNIISQPLVFQRYGVRLSCLGKWSSSVHCITNTLDAMIIHPRPSFYAHIFRLQSPFEAGQSADPDWSFHSSYHAIPIWRSRSSSCRFLYHT